MRRPGAARLVAVAMAAVTVAGCGSSLSSASKRLSYVHHGGYVNVLTDTQGQDAIDAAISRFEQEPKVRGVFARFVLPTPARVADAVKDGSIVDLVVLPPGPALTRIRDELAAPPLRITDPGLSGFYAAPVTTNGVHLADFLAGVPYVEPHDTSRT